MESECSSESDSESGNESDSEGNSKSNDQREEDYSVRTPVYVVSPGGWWLVS